MKKRKLTELDIKLLEKYASTTNIPLTILTANAEEYGLDKTIKKIKKPKLNKNLRKKMSAKRRKRRSKIVPNTYKEYIKSDFWKDRKREYYKNHKKECQVCKSRWRIGLHHISYRNLGKEADDDLVPLCWSCHKKYHDIHGVGWDNTKTTYDFITEEMEIVEFQKITKNL